MDYGFWSINFGNVLTLGALLVSFWAAHISSLKRSEDATTRLAAMESKLNLIYGWFENNVAGRKESQRGMPKP